MRFIGFWVYGDDVSVLPGFLSVRVSTVTRRAISNRREATFGVVLPMTELATRLATLAYMIQRDPAIDFKPSAVDGVNSFLTNKVEHSRFEA